MKKELKKLSDYFLEHSGVYRSYSDEDLFNATEIFVEVFMSKMWDFHKDKLSLEQLEILVKEAGGSIRQTIQLFTGKDMHKIVKKIYNKKN